MRASIIIPVWNGATVVTECLKALYANSGAALTEVICVDNASMDESAALIAAHYPAVRLLPQPVNLGFAGGVNAGMAAATGDLFVLLNQDCLVQPGWLDALLAALVAHPHFGIAGCTIFNADGSINHAGALIDRPSAYGRHLTELKAAEPYAVETVTGAVFAIRRTTWDLLGAFDEAFYPAYYEECDYCYRARRKGLEIGYVPAAHVTHLLTSRAWQTDPVHHTANQHQQRFRFVLKQFDPVELTAFLQEELQAATTEPYFDQAAGRMLGARYTVRHLSTILAQRVADGAEALPPVLVRQVQVGFSQIARTALANLQRLDEDLEQTLQRLKAREHQLLDHIYFRSPDQSKALWPRLWRLLVLRPFRFLSGRDYALHAELHALHGTRQDQLEQQQAALLRRIALLERLAEYDN